MSYADDTLFDAALAARQTLPCELITRAFQRKALPNAYLLSGNGLADKWVLARQIAAALNCVQGPDKSCLSSGAALCTNCNWIAEGAHPGAFYVLESQTDSGKIPVEMARKLVEELSKTSQYFRVAVIPDAHDKALHRPAANALLKSIEEPPPHCLFLLFSEAEDTVLPTIVSRCQVVRVRTRHPSLLEFQPDRMQFVEPAKTRIYQFMKDFLNRPISHVPWKMSAEAQKLSGLLDELTDDDGLEAQEAVDLVLHCSFEILKSKCTNPGAQSQFVVCAGQACESAKQQLDQYVKKNNAVESLAYTLADLRMRFLGEVTVA